MGLNETPSSERTWIGIFGNRNVGKSSLMNAITNQNIAIVSSVKGTTTDPVQKSMELLPLGPVVMIDTPGLDDEGQLGQQRIDKTIQMLHQIHFALIVVEGKETLTEKESELIDTIKDKKLPYLIVVNKADLMTSNERQRIAKAPWYEEDHTIIVSAQDKDSITKLKDMMAQCARGIKEDKPLLRDLIRPNDVVILVTPIDDAAPAGRMILPQQQAIRDVLDGDGICMVTKQTELLKTLQSLKNPPKLVVTDSQVFAMVDKLVPKDIPLTSFSILLARKKGDLQQQIDGAMAIKQLKDGDRILISEGCTHHRQCGDIGTEKLPRLIRNYTQKELHFTFTSGTEFYEDLSDYAIVIHCGGCMLVEQEMKHRLHNAKCQEVPMTNYGVAIAYMNGILDRSIELFYQNKN